MKFKGRALYNLLAMSYEDDTSLNVEPWQVANYRLFSLADLFARLHRLRIDLNETAFLAYADDCDSPEELIDCLWVDEDDIKGHDETYLILFELWRRLVPKKQSLSIFGDELDYRISLYDKGQLEDEESLQQSISELEDVLDNSVDLGARPQETLESVCQYCAQDVKTFLYDYIVDQIQAGNATYASELIDGFYEYIPERKWFDFLRARLFSLSDPKESDVLMRRVLEQLEEEPDPELLFEIAQFLVHGGDVSLFKQAVKQLASLIGIEEELQLVLKMMVDFYRCLDQDHLEKAVSHVLEKRKAKHPEGSLAPSDRSELLRFLEEPNRDKV